MHLKTRHVKASYLTKKLRIILFVYLFSIEGILTLSHGVANEMNNAAKVFESHTNDTTLLELYTSEGCSSCPPAEHWFSQLTHDDRLWKQLFPIAFHVDYWDYLGWRDPFASPTFTLRQRKYERLNYIQQVATPGFVVSGKGWNGWFRRKPLPSYELSQSIGHLKVRLLADDVSINYQLNDPTKSFFKSKSPKAHVAILGFDIVVPIDSGENSGLDFKHDFVVLAYQQTSLIQTDNEWRTHLKKPVPNMNFSHISSSKKPFHDSNSNKRAVVIWVSEGNDPKPMQVTGGWL